MNNVFYWQWRKELISVCSFNFIQRCRPTASRLTAACQITPAHRLKLAQTSPSGFAFECPL